MTALYVGLHASSRLAKVELDFLRSYHNGLSDPKKYKKYFVLKYGETFYSHYKAVNPCPAEPGYTLPLQTV